MKPTFFIIGAPKCGTTSMANWLRENPQVFMPAEKEPCFFSPDLHPSLYATLDEYEALFARVAPHRVHLVVLDDVAEDPEAVFRRVTDFLGVDAEPLPDFTPANTRQIHRWRWLMRLVRAYGVVTERIGFRYQTGVLEWVREWNRRDAERKPLEVELRRRLVAYFEPDVRLLEELTGRDLGHWLT